MLAGGLRGKADGLRFMDDGAVRPAAATRISLRKILSMLLSFSSLSLIEGTHPLEGGHLRRKVRTAARTRLRPMAIAGRGSAGRWGFSHC
jgi:hypothetical protein